MNVYEKIKNKETKIAVVGLGYVGLPLAVAFSEKFSVVGYDYNENKINEYKQGIDPTLEVGDEKIANCTIDFTNDASKLKDASFIVVAVPTPINDDKTPNLTPVVSASETIGKNLSKDTIVVYESTVYPGVTEHICAPILEKESGLKCGDDFKIGYSPERINPGDKVHTLKTIKKVVAGMDEDTLNQINSIYNEIIDAGTYPVTSIMAAEAIKLVENSQRDINIAFMNEVAMAFDRIGIDTNEVVNGMNTKWNALGFRPGLVGGHCIGVDPYYFIHEAEEFGYTSQIVANGRNINNRMGIYVAEAAVKNMTKNGLDVTRANVVIFGITFKENCPDIRNTRVIDIVHTLNEYGINPIIVDPWANNEEVEKEYGVSLTKLSDIKDADCIIHAVSHKEFKELGIENLCKLFRQDSNTNKVLIDVKGQWDIKKIKEAGIKLWRL